MAENIAVLVNLAGSYKPVSCYVSFYAQRAKEKAHIV